MVTFQGLFSSFESTTSQEDFSRPQYTG
jgi:hypothetical protein